MTLVGVWHDGASAFCTGSEEQKQRDLDANPYVAVTTGSTGANGGGRDKDIVVEGTAVRVGRGVVCQVRQGLGVRGARRGVRRARQLRRQHRGGARVYRVETAKVMAFGDDHGQTTYRFCPPCTPQRHFAPRLHRAEWGSGVRSRRAGCGAEE